MQRYFTCDFPGDDIMEKSNDGRWVKWEDVEKYIESFKTAEISSVECNCEEMFRMYTGHYPHPDSEKIWICPAHGYKKL